MHNRIVTLKLKCVYTNEMNFVIFTKKMVEKQRVMIIM
jgi:hypothetical protein